MKTWLNLSKQKQIDLFNQLSALTGMQAQAIEKDAWVTLMLRMLFTSSLKDVLVFKGGTSLSKAYKLIQRFSEDIDIAINRNYLGFEGELTKGQIRKLRRKSHDFVSTEMTKILRFQLNNYDIDEKLYNIKVENIKISDQDPEIIQVNYKSVFQGNSYLQKRVLIEIGARSLTEPYAEKKIQSIIKENYPQTEFSETEFIVKTVIPEKTFLEKLILIHEELQKDKEKVRHMRMSRHLYDIGQIINTEYGKRAIKNTQLFNEIIKHRKKFTPIKVVDYDKLALQTLQIIPKGIFYELYKKDYKEMQESMIYGESLNFEDLIDKIKQIEEIESR